MKKKFIYNILSTMIVFFFSGVIYFFCVPIILESIGKKYFGIVIFFAFLSHKEFFGSFNLSISNVIAKNISADRKRNINGAYFSNAFVACFILGTIFGIIIYLLNPYILNWSNLDDLSLKEEFIYSIVIISFSIPIGFLSFVPIGYLNGIFKTSIVRYVDLFYCLGKFSLFAYFSNKKISLVNFAWSIFIIGMISTILLLIFSIIYKMPLSLPKLHFWKIFRKDKKLMSSLSIIQFLGLSFRHISIILINALAGPSAVSSYEVASKFPFSAKTMLGKCAELFFPLASRYKEQEETMTKITTRILKFFITIAIFFFGIFLITGEHILKLWLGEDFIYLNNLLICSAFILPFHPLSSVITHGLMGQGVRLKEVVCMLFVVALISNGSVFFTYKIFGIYAFPLVSVFQLALITCYHLINKSSKNILNYDGALMLKSFCICIILVCFLKGIVCWGNLKDISQHIGIHCIYLVFAFFLVFNNKDRSDFFLYIRLNNK